MRSTPGDLENRLIDFGADVYRVLRPIPKDPAGLHVSRQLIRSATSAAANYAEARAGESRRDFVHKMQIALKELRETHVWLRFTDRLFKVDVQRLVQECDELVAIFVSSIKTARKTNRDRQTSD